MKKTEFDLRDTLIGLFQKISIPPRQMGLFFNPPPPPHLDFLKHKAPPPGFPGENSRLKFNSFLIENTHKFYAPLG